MWSLDRNALRGFAPGRVVICSDAKPGRQMLHRPYPTQPLAPGTPEQGAHEDRRHGTRALMASLVVAPGQVVWHLGQTRTRTAVAPHLADVVKHLPDLHQDDWVGDKLTPPGSLAVCRVGAPWCPGPCVAKARRHGVQRRAFLRAPRQTPVFPCTPTQGAWLKQVEWWLSVFARRFLQRGNCCAAQNFATRLSASLVVYNTHHAHPYRWTSTGQPLVRATPFSQTRRQQRQGQAWLSSRPQRFARAFYPPRPYKRTAA
jgi:hypothetical protein